ncbi:MAG: methyltransferase domain-containing protein [Polyangiaceae bacterium]
MTQLAMDPEPQVLATYSAAANASSGLCCPVTYDRKLLAAIPREVLERDYGCGDPTPHLAPGETVLDLGCGGGKGAFLAAQVVGPKGKVIGVDMSDDMLGLARRSAPEFARKVGFYNVKFLRGRIQDLALDLDKLDAFLAEHPVKSARDLAALEAEEARLRAASPLVKDGSVDVVVSDCVLNLVRPADKAALFAEIHRVLRRGGRAVISDIVSDEDVPAHLQADGELWTGCISGAMRQDRFLQAFVDAGLYGIEILSRDEKPWRTVEGIEFRSITIAAYKGKEGACMDHKQAVIYRGPFREVVDDDGHRLVRGVPVAVCEKTYGIYARAPYREHFERVAPRVPPRPEEVRPFPCGVDMVLRAPSETKGEGYAETTASSPSCCATGSCS